MEEKVSSFSLRCRYSSQPEVDCHEKLLIFLCTLSNFLHKQLFNFFFFLLLWRIIPLKQKNLSALHPQSGAESGVQQGKMRRRKLQEEKKLKLKENLSGLLSWSGLKITRSIFHRCFARSLAFYHPPSVRTSRDEEEDLVQLGSWANNFSSRSKWGQVNNKLLFLRLFLHKRIKNGETFSCCPVTHENWKWNADEGSRVLRTKNNLKLCVSSGARRRSCLYICALLAAGHKVSEASLSILSGFCRFSFLATKKTSSKHQQCLCFSP